MTALVLAAPFVAGACSSGHHASSTASTTTTTLGVASATACRLLPPADATHLFGETAISTPANRPGGAASTCIYSVAGPSGQLLQFRIYDNGQFYARDQHPDAADVAGLGDKAFVSRAGPSGLVDCQFVKGGLVYAFAYSNLTGNASTKADALVALARGVAGRA
jgi:hypothetical protein